MTDSAPTIQTGTYRHYKGNLYHVMGVARHSETLEWLVLYHPIQSPDSPICLWVRPYKMFVEKLMIDGRKVHRFEFVG